MRRFREKRAKEPTLAIPKRTHRSVPTPGESIWLRSGHTGAYLRPANPNGSEHVLLFIIFRIFFGGATGEKHLLVIMWSHGNWCAWRQLRQIVPCRAFAPHATHANQLAARKADSHAHVKSRPAGGNHARTSIALLYVRIDSLFLRPLGRSCPASHIFDTGFSRTTLSIFSAK